MPSCSKQGFCTATPIPLIVPATRCTLLHLSADARSVLYEELQQLLLPGEKQRSLHLLLLTIIPVSWTDISFLLGLEFSLEHLGINSYRDASSALYTKVEHLQGPPALLLTSFGDKCSYFCSLALTVTVETSQLPVICLHCIWFTC